MGLFADLDWSVIAQAELLGWVIGSLTAALVVTWLTTRYIPNNYVSLHGLLCRATDLRAVLLTF